MLAHTTPPMTHWIDGLGILDQYELADSKIDSSPLNKNGLTDWPNPFATRNLVNFFKVKIFFFPPFLSILLSHPS